MKTLLLVSSLVGIILISNPLFSEAGSALEELKNATSGGQPTGKPFDNSNKPQISDAFPKSNTSSVEKPTGTSVEKSTGTSGGFNVEKSTNTATPEPKPLRQPR